MADSPVLYVYYRPDNDDAYPGVPARHITEADWASFTIAQRRTIENATTQEGYTRRKVWLHRDLVDETEQERADREAAEQAAREAYERGQSIVRWRDFEPLVPGPGEVIVGSEDGPVAVDSSSIGGDVDPALVEQRVSEELAGRDIPEGGTVTEQDLAFAVVDEADRRTWIEADAEGKPSRYAASLIREALASGPNIACYGASGTEGQTGPGTSYPEQLQALLPDRAVTNLGVGGDTSSDIAARQGGNPYLLMPTGGVIPATGSVAVTVSVSSGGSLDLLGNRYMGTLAGVYGRFETTSGGASTFRRTVDGDPVTLTKPTPFYTDLGERHRNDIHILWVGGNNAAELDIVEGDLNAMIHRMGRAEKRFLVIGPLTNENNGIGTPVHDAAVELGQRFFRAYGRRYIDLRRYLIDHGLTDAGIEPTPGDLEDIDNDVHPRSLRIDGIHLTATANGLVAQLVADRLREMGWV